MSRDLQYTTADFVSRALAVHGDRFDYSASEYRGATRPIQIVCREHGPFTIMARKHWEGRVGCTGCRDLRLAETNGVSWDEFLERARGTHGNKYQYVRAEYTRGLRSMMNVTCPEHGVFQVRAKFHVRGIKEGCPYCYGATKRARCIRSSTENKMYELLSPFGKIEGTSRVLYPEHQMEIDLYFPDHQFAVECNGLYWHRAAARGDLHREKLLACRSKGIHLIQPWENEITYQAHKIVNLVQFALAEKVVARVGFLRLTPHGLYTLSNSYMLGHTSRPINYGLGIYVDHDIVGALFAHVEDRRATIVGVAPIRSVDYMFDDAILYLSREFHVRIELDARYADAYGLEFDALSESRKFYTDNKAIWAEGASERKGSLIYDAGVVN